MNEAKPPATYGTQPPRGTSRDVANFLLVIALAVVAFTGLPTGHAPIDASGGREDRHGSTAPDARTNPQLSSPPVRAQRGPPAMVSGASIAPEPATRPPTPCEAAAARAQPVNGKELLQHDRSGIGKLYLKNGTDYPGVGVLIDSSTRRPFRAMYVHASSTATMLRVNPGTYRLQFALGQTWLEDEGRFCRTAGVSEFERPLGFAEISKPEGILYDVIEVTFHKMEGGNAPTRDLPPEAFALTLMGLDDGE